MASVRFVAALDWAATWGIVHDVQALSMTNIRRKLDRLGAYPLELKTLPADLALRWRLDGWLGVWDDLRGRTLHRVFRRGRFLVYALDLNELEERPPPPGVRIEEFRGVDWNALASIVTRRKLERFRRRARSGRTCLVAWRGTDPIGYAWYSDRMAPELEHYELPLPRGAVYGWDLYVMPAERGCGVGTALAVARLLHARRRGFTSGWRIVHTSNLAAQRTAEKSGVAHGRPVGELDWLKLFARSRFRFRPRGGAEP